jgi:hypothetical protein
MIAARKANERRATSALKVVVACIAAPYTSFSIEIRTIIVSAACVNWSASKTPAN